MASGALFPSVSNPTSPGALQKRILSQDCLIPTFGDFWRNFNYFCLLRNVVALVHPRRLNHSVYETLQSLYHGNEAFERAYRDL